MLDSTVRCDSLTDCCSSAGLAEELSRRMAWTIRQDLIPLFGPTFPTRCLPPHSPGFGIVSLEAAGCLPTGAGTARRATTPLRGRPSSAQTSKKKGEKRSRSKEPASSLGLTDLAER